jgi:histidinol dehydrogenase
VVQSLNALNQTVRTAETNTSNRQPQQILNEVRNTAENTTTNEGENALQRLGIATQQDGTFTVNQRQLDQSFQADPAEAQDALDELSNNLNRVAEQQLNGRTVQPEPTDNTQQAQNIRQAIVDEEAREQQRSQQDARESFRQLLAAQLANAGSFSARNAVTTYFNVSTL